jgi:YHS domain-containing protein
MFRKKRQSMRDMQIVFLWCAGYGVPRFLQRLTLLTVIGMVIVLTGCGTTHASYRNASQQEVMLLGFDPVSYFTHAKPLRGNHTMSAVHEGRTYYFADTANRARFVQSPASFEPQYGGFCANGAAYGMKWASNPTSFEIADGRLYIFSGWGSHASWILDKSANIQHADALWSAEAATAGWRWQSVKRMMFKVSHYQSNEALNMRWAERFPNKEKPASQNGGFWANFTRAPGWQAAEGLGQAPVGWPN